MSSTKVTALLAVRANTRPVLATELVARNAEIAALREEVAILQVSAPWQTRTGAGNTAPKNVAPRTLPAHFVAAREMAMRTGKCIRVQA